MDPAVLIHEIDPFIPVSGSHIAKELQSAFRILSQGDYAILAVVSGELFKGDGLDLSGRKFLHDRKEVPGLLAFMEAISSGLGVSLGPGAPLSGALVSRASEGASVPFWPPVPEEPQAVSTAAARTARSPQVARRRSFLFFMVSIFFIIVLVFLSVSSVCAGLTL